MLAVPSVVVEEDVHVMMAPCFALVTISSKQNGDRNGEEVVVQVMMAPCFALVTISGSTQ